MKLYIHEGYEDDMIAYKQAMADYNQWKSNTPQQVYKRVNADMRNTATTLLTDRGINKEDIFVVSHAPSFRKK